MQDSNLTNEKDQEANNIKIIQTDIGAKDGQNKCPKCGATDIALNVNKGRLRCNYCRYEFEAEKAEDLEIDINKLEGQIVGSGAQNIVADTDEILTFKCSSCAAEVVIDTASATQARCHWCRNTLSINQQIPNGAVPDMVLPFGIKKDEARAEIEKFVKKRKFFAHPKFKAEFTTNNILGVYLPYMVVDINAHSNLTGQGEVLVRTYTRGSGDDRKTYYDADLYDVGRDFDITIDGLTVESSADKLDNTSSAKTNNVINAIMPFDIENCVKWNANYLRGYTSEKRDTNIEHLQGLVDNQARDVARFAANDTLEKYNRGVAWTNEQLAIKGQQWKAAYLPIWLYSYQQIKGNKKLLHYVAVNARTKETMGSVPINMSKLFGVSAIVEAIGLFFWWVIFIDWDYGWTFILLGFIFFAIMYARYRNKDARHKHEEETPSQKNNIKGYDNYVKRRTGLSNSRINGANNTSIIGQKTSNKVLKSMLGNSPAKELLNNNFGRKNK